MNKKETTDFYLSRQRVEFVSTLERRDKIVEHVYVSVDDRHLICKDVFLYEKS